MLCFLKINIVILCGIIFHCNFFNDYEIDHYKSGRGAKTKKFQLDLYLEEPRLNKKTKFKVRSSLSVERALQSVFSALFNSKGSHKHSDNHCCF